MWSNACCEERKTCIWARKCYHQNLISCTSRSRFHTRWTELKNGKECISQNVKGRQIERKERNKDSAPPQDPQPLAIWARALPLCWEGATDGRQRKWALILWKSTSTPTRARSNKLQVCMSTKALVRTASSSESDKPHISFPISPMPAAVKKGRSYAAT